MMVLLLLVILMASWSLQVSLAQQDSPVPEFKLAVVNVVEVLTKCQANLDKEKEINSKKVKIETDLRRLAAETNAIKQELENALEPGSQEFMARHREWFHKQVEAQSLTKYQAEVLSIESQAWTETLYENLLAETEKLAKQKEISLVINKDESPIQGRKLPELYDLIINRKVLYNTANLDLTAEVLQNIDDAYEREKNKK